MRYLKLSSAENPSTDFIELNDFNGFLCTSFQSLGISRKLEFLAIDNRQFSVANKTEFKKYILIVQILSKYGEYEAKYKELITFLDRNKKGGFRLYYRPYDNMDLRYCLCDIESSVKIEKMQPVTITLSQNSLWINEQENVAITSAQGDSGNIFAFTEDSGIEDYYCVGFNEDNDIVNPYFCIPFSSNASSIAEIVNSCYNEIPLTIRIYGQCQNPTVYLFRKGETTPIRKTQVIATISSGYYVEINAHILKNGVWYVNNSTGEKIDYSELINNEYGSPYFYIDNGEYYIEVRDDGNNVCDCYIFWQEEYSE